MNIVPNKRTALPCVTALASAPPSPADQQLPRAIVRDHDPRNGLRITLPVNNGEGSVIFEAGTGSVPGLDGRSLVPLFSAKGAPPAWRHSFPIEYNTDIVFPRMLNMGYDAVRNERYKFIRYRDLTGMNELYDLRKDPYELRNLIDSKESAELRRRMERELDALLRPR